jgi:hypothetical protein
VGATNEEFKFPLVVWDRVCSPLTMGALGIWKMVLIKLCWDNGFCGLGEKRRLCGVELRSMVRRWVASLPSRIEDPTGVGFGGVY